MAKKKIAAKARPQGRNKPASRPVKKVVKAAKAGKPANKGKKVVKAAAKGPTAKGKKVAVKKIGGKKAVVFKAKKSASPGPKKGAKKAPAKAPKKVAAKPVKALKKPVKAVKTAPVKPLKVVMKAAPIAALPSSNGASKKPAVAPKAPLKASPIAKAAPVAKPATKAVPAAETRTAVVATKPAPAPVLAKKPLKERVTIEFMVQSSPAVLYEMISSPSGFAEWYCTDVNVRGDQYTFIWPDEEEETTLIGRKLGEVIRFHRNNDDDEASYFEFRVRIDGMTNEVALIVTDHAWPAEVEETRNLWSSQIASLLRVLGA